MRKSEHGDDRNLHDDPGPTNGIWGTVDWLKCRDVDPVTGLNKWRPVEPGTFPLAHGAAERVGRLRGYGNAIVAEQAKIFIETAKECLNI
jgi:DNA (cytosine-5)-methyltransferase 1